MQPVPTDAAGSDPVLSMSAALALPTGSMLTIDAAPGSQIFELAPHIPDHPDYRVGYAVATALSPDGRTLAVLTSGYNGRSEPTGDVVPERSEYVFLYDVTSAGLTELAVVPVAQTFIGLAFSKTGDRLFVSGGPDDDVHEFSVDPATRALHESVAPVLLGHFKTVGLGGLGLDEGPYAAGLDSSANGKRLAIANHENDSLAIVDLVTRKSEDVDLRPGDGRAGGEFPMGVVITSDERAYVTSQRDREVVEVDLNAKRVLRRIRVGGQPTRIVASRDAKKLFVANANTDSVSIIDRESGSVIEEFRVSGPAGSLPLAYRGSNPNALRLSPDERTLYVSLGGSNAIAIVQLATTPQGVSEVKGLVPTGFYPNDVSVSQDGRFLFVAYGKSVTGPNPRGPRASNWTGGQFALQLMRGGVHAFPIPNGRVLDLLTHQVLENNHADAPPTVPPIFSDLKGKVQHVIFVIGENRTYDQMLGDIDTADGDPSLTMWGESVTPNLHALVKRSVLLDRFFDSGGVSGDGWLWTMGASSTDVAEKAIPLEYASRGHHSYDWEGNNRNINMGLATLDERLKFNPKTPKDPNLLPGVSDVGAVDGPAQGGRGYLWDAAIAAGLSIRNYGCFEDDYRLGLPATDKAKLRAINEPYKTKTRIAFPASPGLQDVTDPYFAAFDMRTADYWREHEWEREFDEQEKTGTFPALELVRLPRDHTGSFARAEDGVNTPDTQIADHDYALGLLIERVSKSPYWENTIIIALEDDAQDGADHVDAHRSFVVFAGGHVRRNAGTIHTRFATPSVLRTIELLLNIAPMAQADATASPITQALTNAVDTERYVAVVPDVLRSTRLRLPKLADDNAKRASVLPRGDARYWELATMGMDFDHADRLPTDVFNQALVCKLLDSRGCVSTAASRTIAEKDDDDD